MSRKPISTGPVTLLADTADDELRERLHGPVEELRLVAVELWVRAQLALDRHSLAITELTPLVARYPTREQLVAILMTALSRRAVRLALPRRDRPASLMQPRHLR